MIFFGIWFLCGIIAAAIFSVDQAKNYGYFDIECLVLAVVALVMGPVGIVILVKEYTDDHDIGSIRIWERKNVNER